MFKILDRYLTKEILLPFFMALVVFTFILEIPPILLQGEKLIEKGVAWPIVIRILLTLLPQALSVTVPIALLVGILVGLGRFSGDREFVALQACGVSLFRLLRPITLLAALTFGATIYETIWALPDANQTFRELTFGVVAARAEGDVKPRVFFEDFPNLVLYVRDIAEGGGWRDVFLADMRRADQTTVYFAQQGQLLIDRQQKTVRLLMRKAVRHTTQTAKPEAYERNEFDSITISMDPETVFPRAGLPRGDAEMTIAELRASIREVNKFGDPGYRQNFMIQQKFSLPAACPVLALIALALGASNKKGGKFASFAQGIGVVFVYYILLYTGRALALGTRITPSWGPWIPNIVLGVVGVALFVWRVKAADQPVRLNLPQWLLFWRRPKPEVADSPAAAGAAPRAGRRVVVVVRIPHVHVPRPRLLDLYVSGQYLRIFALGVVALLGIFYIATFMDVAEKLFRGSATTGMLMRYLYFQTPQYIYYVIPMAVLVSTLVTIGLMTKNSELIVIRACGVSLYRTALPLMLFAAVTSGMLFGLQEDVIAESNRQADVLLRIIKGFPPRPFGAQNRRWLVGANGDIYHYEMFEPHQNRFSRFTRYHIDQQRWQLNGLAYAASVSLSSSEEDSAPTSTWSARGGSDRTFSSGATPRAQLNVHYEPFDERALTFEPSAFFKTEDPDAERMSFGELRSYIDELKNSGLYVTPYMVELNRKIAFPFVTVVMTLLAVPFAVTTGRRGTMYGIGVGIVLAIVYWIALSIFAALGKGGLLAPMLAAWAPNILFAAAAAYLLLTVRT